MSQAAIRVLVVDDSALYRQMLLNVLGRIPEVDVVGVAEDGNQAVEMVASLHPDVLTLDVQMPGLDGIGVLRALSERGLSSRAIMVSSLTQEGAPAATAAIFEGAFDVIAKPAGLPPHEAREFLSRQLVEKIAVVRAASEPSKGPAGNGPAGVARRRADKPVAVDVVAIASSTGGPPVLREILSALPADFPAAVLVVQHMPPVFTSSLAARLDTVCPLMVVEAADHMLVEPGTVLIAPGGVHLSVRRRAMRSARCLTMRLRGMAVGRRLTCLARRLWRRMARGVWRWCSLAWAATAWKPAGRSRREVARCSPKPRKPARCSGCPNA